MIPKVVLLLYEVGQNVGVVTHCLRKKHFKVTKARAAMVDNWLRVSEGTWSQFRLQEPAEAGLKSLAMQNHFLILATKKESFAQVLGSDTC